MLRDKQVALIGEQTGCPFGGTNRMSILGDKQFVLISGTNWLPLLDDKQDVLIGGQTGCPYWGTNRLPLLEDKQVDLSILENPQM